MEWENRVPTDTDSSTKCHGSYATELHRWIPITCIILLVLGLSPTGSIWHSCLKREESRERRWPCPVQGRCKQAASPGPVAAAVLPGVPPEAYRGSLVAHPSARKQRGEGKKRMGHTVVSERRSVVLARRFQT